MCVLANETAWKRFEVVFRISAEVCIFHVYRSRTEDTSFSFLFGIAGNTVSAVLCRKCRVVSIIAVIAIIALHSTRWIAVGIDFV